MKKLKWVLLPAALVLAAGYPKKTNMTRYTVRSAKIKNPVRIVIFSDLHGASFGKNMQDLIHMIRGENPDLVLIPGDLCDEFSKDDNAFALLDGLRGLPMYYATGNHEEHRGDAFFLGRRLELHGVKVLDHTAEIFSCGDTKLEIGGIPCRDDEAEYVSADVSSVFTSDHYRILLSHRPHWIDLYSRVDCDLIISGHAHGGQWCIPGTDIGLGAPQQGFLPKYISGIHHLGRQDLLISRGLVRDYHYLPRLFNDPEAVSLTLLPEAEG
ncbi:MAG: metallophosphoesterase [Solobacterium sp.]|nr:metallophosphoesterase [Solobacterium sp.]